MGPELMANVRNFLIPVSIILILVFAGLYIFFLLNYRLLMLLEREDWPALAYYLEQKIYKKGRYSSRKVRLLASSYMVISDFSSVLHLESKAMAVKPSVIDKNILIFGAARILGGNYKEAAAFFKARMEKGNVAEQQWVRWFYGFSVMLSGVFNQAETEFLSLADSSSDAIVAGLSAYFLSNNLAARSLDRENCRAAAENGRKRVVLALKNKAGWKKEIDKMGTEIYTSVIRKYINEAGDWIFSPK